MAATARSGETLEQYGTELQPGPAKTYERVALVRVRGEDEFSDAVADAAASTSDGTHRLDCGDATNATRLAPPPYTCWGHRNR